uniref:Cathepsin H n=3 Tax=Hominidae TaxID=9604 RepID=A0A087X0D5_HUMAN
MWATLPLLCAGAWLLGVPVCGAAELCVNSLEKFHFKSWMSKHRKTYSTEEYHHRLQTFASNWRKINAHNNGNHTFKMALNQFSDMSFAEIKHKYLWSEPQNCSATKSNYLRGTGPYPPSVDWRKKGNFVSPVKNQGACGSCWTFSTTGALESAIAIATGKMLSLAEQQLVDCAQDFNNHGCQGGLPSQAFEYILYNKGIMGEDTYPYQGKDGYCKFQPGKAIGFVKDVANITIQLSASCRRGYEHVLDTACVKLRRYDEEAMVEAVALYNPVSFAFEVTQDFMMYRTGIYSSTSCHKTPDKVNHAVLAVGYGEKNGIPYWIVKNSWGPQWGMNGYFLIERGKNMCGLAACASYPIPLV